MSPGPLGARFSAVLGAYREEVAAAGLGAGPDWGLDLRGGVEQAGPGPSSIHTVHYDGNFKLNAINWRGRARLAAYQPHYPQLPRRHLFISNDRVLATLGDGAASMDIGPNHCSNFNADKVLAAASRKVRWKQSGGPCGRGLGQRRDSARPVGMGGGRLTMALAAAAPCRTSSRQPAFCYAGTACCCVW